MIVSAVPWKDSTTMAVSSANALTTDDGTHVDNLRNSTSDTTAKRSGDRGHPCLTPLRAVKPGIIFPLTLMKWLVMQIKLLDSINPGSRQSKVSQDLPQVLLRNTREGRVEVEKQQRTVSVVETYPHGVVVYVDDVCKHGPALQEASLLR